MSDRDFIELLNLYVDREISAADAQRLEAEVAKNAKRREVYDEYCRIQKACSMLSEESFELPEPHPVASLVSFPVPSRAWRFGAIGTGLAAAAAVAVAYLGLHQRAGQGAAAAAALDATAQVRSVSASSTAPSDADGAMKPVFFVRLPSESPVRGAQLASADAAAQIAQLSWISDIHVSPAPAFPAADFLALKGESKASLGDAQPAQQDQEPLEMTAFRFQR